MLLPSRCSLSLSLCSSFWCRGVRVLFLGSRSPHRPHHRHRAPPEFSSSSFSYFLTDNIALELIAATTQHDLDWSNPSLDAGSVRLLPPTLTLQYHFMPESRWSPYVGAGINYTFFYDSKPGQFNSVKYDDGFGYAFQAGFDYAISGPWSVNLDVKKIFLDTDVSINNGANTSKAHLDPWVFGLGIGYRF